MFFIRPPTEEFLRATLQKQAGLDFTYPDVGATATTPPDNYTVDHTRVRLGAGDEVFRRAKIGLRGWKQFSFGWLNAFPEDTPICAGELIAVVAHTFGVWSVNVARIIYVIDEPRRFGFAYGTMPGHVEQGEERFLLEQTDDDSVWYDILAFSRPRHILARIGKPLVRRLQKRFGRESTAAMRRAAGETSGKPE